MADKKFKVTSIKPQSRLKKPKTKRAPSVNRVIIFFIIIQGYIVGKITGTGACVQTYADRQGSSLESHVHNNASKYVECCKKPFVEYSKLTALEEDIDGRIKRIITPIPGVDTEDTVRRRIAYYYANGYMSALFNCKAAIEVRKAEIMSWMKATATHVNVLSNEIMGAYETRVCAFRRGALMAIKNPGEMAETDEIHRRFLSIVEEGKVYTEEADQKIDNIEGGDHNEIKEG